MMGPTGWIWMLIWIAALVFMVWLIVRRPERDSSVEDARSILRARFARGEISETEFERACNAADGPAGDTTMTTRISAAIAAGFLAFGILVGAAGTIIARDATTTDLAEQMGGMTASASSMGSTGGMMSMMDGGDMARMMSMMGAGHMADMSSMMGAGHMADMSSMMGGGGSSMMPKASTAPDASTSPQDHLEHHASPSPAATR